MNENQFSAFIAALPLPALLVGADERVSAINSLACALLATNPLGLHYVAGLRQPVLLDAVEQALSDHGTRRSRYRSTQGGHDKSWEVSVSRIAPDANDAALAQVLVTFQDVTAVEEAGQMRRDFVANVSHEMRTPLTAIMGFIETLQNTARDDPNARDRFLGLMDLEAGRLARLVDDLLQLSRVESNENHRPQGRVDLSALCEDVIIALSDKAEAAGMRLCLSLAAKECTIQGDFDQLRQLLVNLIENAIKYGADGERVDVSLSSLSAQPHLHRDGVQLSVCDQGAGVEAHHIARLTERFYRADGHRSRDVGGTGLGLAIVKHIVNRHRGRLRIKSAPGEGTCITVILPQAI